MDSALDFHTARALLEWQVELGATEAIGDAPVNRYELDAGPQKTSQEKTVSQGAAGAARAIPVAPAQQSDPADVAQAMAASAGDLDALRQAIDAFELCDLKRGARSLVFADGNPSARVMIIGEAPGREEDSQGKPFVGRAGQLLDRMLAAIDMSRDGSNPEKSVYITNVLPWRPPQNRDPKPEEIGMMLPFVARHVELVNPDVIVLMGNISCQAILGRRGITRLRGNWTQGLNKPVMPMFHPAYLLRQPAAKKHAWADLLELRAKLKEMS